MPTIYPFRAIQYHNGTGDVSALVAPPYDVLDAAGKARLLAGDKPNIVAIDLPHTPAKELGPPETYAAAAERFRQWQQQGILSRRETPAIFAYRQTFTFNGKTHHRTGMACCIETLPFGPRAGGGVLPHEETFSGPKEDRFALMKATRTQLSPIFGLHPDEKAQAKMVLAKVIDRGPADLTATMADGVKHEVWTVSDQPTIDAYADALRNEDVFIADGHHRYTTALNYLRALEGAGQLPPDHPARRCMFVLIGFSDAGLVIGPTHRVLGGMKDYTFEKFQQAAGALLDIKPGPANLQQIETAMHAAANASRGRNVFGLYDFGSQKSYVATLKSDDPLRARFPNKPEAWRKLDVALIQYSIVEEIAQPTLNAGQPVKWAFPHAIEEVLDIGRGAETGAGGGKGFAQLAVIVRPTPLESVRAVSKANELMPQKSTFFYPKLATGLFVNALE